MANAQGKAAAYEFGGPWGVFFLMLWSHYILYYFWYILEVGRAGVGGLYEQPDREASGPMPMAEEVGGGNTAHAACVRVRR
jgi:hypothetical protein